MLTDESKTGNSGFIKTTETSQNTLSSPQKALLNRRGNEFFNSGDVEAAKRIFMTTGYSDGLTRIGDYYAEKNLEIDALKMYWLAHNRRKFEPIIKNISGLISAVIEK